jgi:4-aminobutyrate aminotransferase-like enzyme
MSVQAHFALVHVPEVIDLTEDKVIDLTDEVTVANYGAIPDTVVSNSDVPMNNLNHTTFDFSPSEIRWLKEDQWQARHA